MKSFLLIGVLVFTGLFTLRVNGASEGEKAIPCKVKYGEFTLDVGLHRNDTVKVHYAIPLDKFGKPGPNAHNIVFYAPSLNAKKIFSTVNKQNRKITNEKLCFTEEDGYTMFTFDIVSDISEVESRDKIYYYKESGWHDLVFRVQEMLRKKFDLKKRKLLIVGLSSGGSMGEQLAVYYPDKIDAIAIGGGHRFDLPKKGNKVAWLSLHVAGDFMSLESQYKLQ